MAKAFDIFEALTRHAVVVGIDRYGEGIRDLDNAAHDAREVADKLHSAQGYTIAEPLLDEQATRQALESRLKALQTVGERSAIVLYFAGHGMAELEGDDGPQGYLLLADSDLRDVSTWLAMSELSGWLKDLPARHQLVILDCCFAGSFRWAVRRDVLPRHRRLFESQARRFLRLPSRQVLTSVAHDQSALDGWPIGTGRRPAGNHSPFAEALLAGLDGAADASRPGQPADGLITANELYDYIGRRVDCLREDRLTQTPGLSRLDTASLGEFVFRNPQIEHWQTLDDPSLDSQTNPWLGLETYGGAGRDAVADERLYFGRSDLVAQLVKELADPERHGLIALVGTSGSGKSSCVRAGVLPALQRRCPELEILFVEASGDKLPGPRVSGSANRRLIVVDGMEAILDSGKAASENFCLGLRQCLAAGDRVLVTLRSDFESRFEDSALLGDLWIAGRRPMPAPSLTDLRQIIVGPATQRALFFEPKSIIDHLAEEAIGRSEALPLLSLALAETFRRALERRAAEGSIDRALMPQDLPPGGLGGIVNRRANELLAEADEPQTEILRQLFLRLLVDDGGRRRSRRLSLEELDAFEDPQQVKQIADTWVGERLLARNADGYLSTAHDVLILGWSQIDDWISETPGAHGGKDTAQRRVDLRLRHQVWEATRAWRKGRGQGLLRGVQRLWTFDPRLPLARRIGDDLNRLEEAFIGTSFRLAFGLRWGLVGFSALVFWMISSFALTTFHQAHDLSLAELDTAQQSKVVIAERRAAEDRARVAAASQALAEGDAVRAGHLALEVRQPTTTPAAPDLLQRLIVAPYAAPLALEARGTASALAFSADGHWLIGAVGAGEALEIVVWDARDGQLTGAWQAADVDGEDASISRSLRRLAHVAFLAPDIEPGRVFVGLVDTLFGQQGFAEPLLSEVHELTLDDAGELQWSAKSSWPASVVALVSGGQGTSLLITSQRVHWLAPGKLESHDSLEVPWRFYGERWRGGGMTDDSQRLVLISARRVLWIDLETRKTVGSWTTDDPWQLYDALLLDRPGSDLVVGLEGNPPQSRLITLTSNESGVTVQRPFGSHRSPGSRLQPLGRRGVLIEAPNAVKSYGFDGPTVDEQAMHLGYDPRIFTGSSDGQRVAIARDGQAEIRALAQSDASLRRLEVEFLATAFGEQGPLLLVADGPSSSHLRFLGGGARDSEISLPEHPKKAMLSHNGEVLLTLPQEGGRVKTWTTADGQPLADFGELPESCNDDPGSGPRSRPLRGRLCQVALDPSGRHVVWRTPDARRLLDARTGASLSELSIPPDIAETSPGPLTFTSSGSHFAELAYEATEKVDFRGQPPRRLVVWASASGEPIATVPIGKSQRPVLDADGRWLVVVERLVGVDRCVVWDLTSSTHRPVGDDQLACAPQAFIDTRRLGTVIGNRAFALIDVESGDVARRIPFDQAPQSPLWSDPWLVAPERASFAVLDLRRGQRVATLLAEEAGARCQLMPSPSADQLLSACKGSPRRQLGDGRSDVVRLWSHPAADPAALQGRMARQQNVCLAATQRQDLLGEVAVTAKRRATACQTCRATLIAAIGALRPDDSPGHSRAWRHFQRCRDLLAAER